MKAVLLALVLAAPLHAAEFPSFDEVITDAEPDATIDVEIDNTSGLSDAQLLAEIGAVMQADPAFKGKLVNLTVGSAAEVFDFAHVLMKPMVETIGIKETLSPSQFARDVGSVVGSAVGGVHGSASVHVKVTESNKKNPDGSSESSKSVDVTVTVSAGKK